MRLLDRLNLETRSTPRELEAVAFLRFVQAQGYRRFLGATLGFIAPVESAIAKTPGIERVIGPRLLGKAALLRRDLIALGFAGQITSITHCPVPPLESVEEVLGWAYVIERSTLAHHELFRSLASIVPGQVAFASSYLKCYAGTIGERWRDFTDAIDAIETESARERVVHAANLALQAHASWFRVREATPTGSPLARSGGEAAES